MTYSRLAPKGRPDPPAGALTRCTLTADRDAPRRARAFLDDLLAERSEELRARARQVVTELVTNSVTHTDGESVSVEARLDPWGGLDIDVRDDGPGFEVRPRAPGHDETEGWGLVFVDLLSESWASGGPGAPVVWAHLDPRDLDTEPVARHDPGLDDRVRDMLDVRMLLESVKDHAIFGMDRGGRITLWNAGAERLTGYSTDEILGTSIAALHDDLVIDAELATALAHGRHASERWMSRKDGSRFWADSVLTPIYDPRGTLRGFSAVARDATWRKHFDDDRAGLIARIRHLARTDELTSLPNRRRWHEELDREMARARRNNTWLCVAMVDLDNFKEFNDLHGHLAGDNLLRTTAESWAAALRATDLLARYGGDEFSVILPDCAVDAACTAVNRLRDATPAPATCSVGLACSQGAEATEAVVRRADAALYEAKRRGRNLTVSPGD